ncbi:hypothetical protein [Desulfosarcina variabilis]|uniref:hypothetical protein n=1 Tax=Desulfosarcina variabilis TaxID=2300 RepID=UPI003AFA4582
MKRNADIGLFTNPSKFEAAIAEGHFQVNETETPNAGDAARFMVWLTDNRRGPIIWTLIILSSATQTTI